MMVPEQPFLGPLYSPAEVLDPSAFMGLDSTAEFLQDRAGKKWLLCCDCLSLAGFRGCMAGKLWFTSPTESWWGN